MTYLTGGWQAGADCRVEVGVGVSDVRVTSSIGGWGNVRMTLFMDVVRFYSRMCLPFGLL